jgi:hypothetical protein
MKEEEEEEATIRLFICKDNHDVKTTEKEIRICASDLCFCIGIPRNRVTKEIMYVSTNLEPRDICKINTMVLFCFVLFCFQLVIFCFYCSEQLEKQHPLANFNPL